MATYNRKKGLNITRYYEIKRLRALNYWNFEEEMIKIFDEIERLKKIEEEIFNFLASQSDEKILEDVKKIIKQHCNEV